MIYKNPVVKGFYPDPSVCRADDGLYYMVCSSFQYFPGVPLLRSSDLVNWEQIGSCITRTTQADLSEAESSAGIFAPTIRYHNGRFYMVTTNTSANKNFYLYTDDITKEWSDPVFVDQDGIDPSLFFDDGKVYFISNGTDDEGNEGITQCEIDISTGKKLSPSRTIWKGSGGRFLEGPHMYKINGTYYLLAAEGGTEYGHMITYAKSSSVWGEFESYPGNPVLTNRDLGTIIIQGAGHGELVESPDGEWFMIHLGFRQEGEWLPYHHLGREVFMTPVQFKEDGWFTAGTNGTVGEEYEIKGCKDQKKYEVQTFANTPREAGWVYLRKPDINNYSYSEDKYVLHGTNRTLFDRSSPTFTALRQRDFNGTVNCSVRLDGRDFGEAGITMYMDEDDHYDVCIRRNNQAWLDTRKKYEAVLKLNIGDIRHIQAVVPLPPGTDNASFIIEMTNTEYTFSVVIGEKTHTLGKARTKYLSSESAGGFTGVMIGLYASDGTAEFTDLKIQYC